MHDHDQIRERLLHILPIYRARLHVSDFVVFCVLQRLGANLPLIKKVRLVA